MQVAIKPFEIDEGKVQKRKEDLNARNKMFADLQKKYSDVPSQLIYGKHFTIQELMEKNAKNKKNLRQKNKEPESIFDHRFNGLGSPLKFESNGYMDPQEKLPMISPSKGIVVAKNNLNRVSHGNLQRVVNEANGLQQLPMIDKRYLAYNQQSTHPRESNQRISVHKRQIGDIKFLI